MWWAFVRVSTAKPTGVHKMIGLIIALALLAAGIGYVVFELGQQLKTYVEGDEE